MGEKYINYKEADYIIILWSLFYIWNFIYAVPGQTFTAHCLFWPGEKNVRYEYTAWCSVQYLICLWMGSAPTAIPLFSSVLSHLFLLSVLQFIMGRRQLVRPKAVRFNEWLEQRQKSQQTGKLTQCPAFHRQWYNQPIVIINYAMFHNSTVFLFIRGVHI